MEKIQTTTLPATSTVENNSIKQCQNCNQTQKQLLRCARCKNVYYCGVQCQKKNWPSHKINCSKPNENTTSSSQKKNNQNTTTNNTQPHNQFYGLNEFGKLTHLGSGNFSQIFKATSKKDGKTYAIKQVQKAKVQRIRKQADLFMEKHCLSKLKDCDYVIKLYRTFQDELNLFIQMQCPENGQLWQKCKTFGFFSQPIFKYYASHLVKAVSIIHSQHEIVHRDLKPENILLDHENKIKLIDFGTAKDLSRPDIKGSGNGAKGKKVFEHYVGTPNYMAPECIRNKASQKKSDVYSLSGIFYFMKVGAPPFTGGSEFIVFKKSLQNKIDLCPQLFSPELRDLILHMNKKQISERYDIEQVMKHEYFKDTDFDNLPTYQEARSKSSEIQKILELNGKEIYQKFYKIAQEGESKQRKAVFDNQICPIIQALNKKLQQMKQFSEEEIEWWKKRVEMMMIQCKVMMNYYDDGSTGFVQIYHNDLDSAERIINQVRNAKVDQSDEGQANQIKGTK